MTLDLPAVERLLGGRAVDDVVTLHGDGSSRRYARVFAGRERFVLLEGPDRAENEVWVRVARHLAARGVRVPQIFGEDPSRGWVLMEDLGDLNLFSAVSRCGSPREIVDLYAPVFDLLVTMQVGGADGFDLSLGCGTPYDEALRVEWEGMYFVREFAVGFLRVPVPDGFRAELERLSAEAGAASHAYFLHRDFQSRNVQVTPEGPALIDFQGARPGPLGYDAAALVLDPYVAHPAPLREQLLSGYWERLEKTGRVDGDEVRASWFSLGTFRLLQALGAFGKLGGRLGKPGFLEHAPRALKTLAEHLGERGRSEFPAIFGVVGACGEQLKRR